MTLQIINCEVCATANDSARAAIRLLKANPNAGVYIDGFTRVQISKAIIAVAGSGLYGVTNDGGRVLVTVRRQFALKK